MKIFKLLPVLLLITACSQSPENNKPVKISVIPKPLELKSSDKTILLDKTLTININKEDSALRGVAVYLKNRFETALSNCTINIKTGKDVKGINLKLNTTADTSLGDEGYRLETGETTTISANTPAGVFYGVQTLFQLLPPEIFGTSPAEFKLVLPVVEITDKPRFAYRGMHLDPCRYFFTIETTKRYLDYMAYHKLNKFHWHLTEDQGWRIEIKRYPKLTEIGSKRAGTYVYGFDVPENNRPFDSVPVEGYYTQQQIKEIVKYAADRFIEVIPEIEMPGHSLAALAAYPELSCNGGPFKVLERWGVSRNVYCAGNDSVFTFLYGVIDEVVELFPSKYIHIGGDECPKDSWKECPKCQKRIKDQGLKDEKELQSWFIAKMEKYINSKGKTLIGWSEIMEGGIAPNAVLQSWLGTSAGVEAALQHHQTIMSPYQYLYFDGIYVDKAHRKSEPYGQVYCWTNNRKVYSFEPVPDTLSDELSKYFIGAEGTMWSEYISTPQHLEYMLMPRVAALSEITWTSENNKDYKDFSNRMNEQYLRYDAMEANYRIPPPEAPDTVFTSVTDSVIFINPTEVTRIKYTTDGSDPDNTSLLYDSPVKVKPGTVIKAVCFNRSGRKSPVKTVIVE
jgi:hexosaminidase